jgi:hypothetical protein
LKTGKAVVIAVSSPCRATFIRRGESTLPTELLNNCR